MGSSWLLVRLFGRASISSFAIQLQSSRSLSASRCSFTVRMVGHTHTHTQASGDAEVPLAVTCHCRASGAQSNSTTTTSNSSALPANTTGPTASRARGAQDWDPVPRRAQCLMRPGPIGTYHSTTHWHAHCQCQWYPHRFPVASNAAVAAAPETPQVVPLAATALSVPPSQCLIG